MKVTEIETFAVDGNWRELVFVKITTDEGITGVGECTLETRRHAVEAAIQDMQRYVLGQDPFQIEKIWNTMYRDGYWGTGPIAMTAISAIDQALWDIVGKKLKTPVYQLLGGKMREKLKVYANGWYFGLTTVEQHVEKVGQLVEKGFRAFKWDPFRISGREISREDFDYAIECVAKIREKVGPSVELLIEGHGRFNTRNAVRISRALEPYDPFFFEEPLPPDNFDALKRVADQVNIPLAAGERIYSYYHYRDFLSKQAVHIIQPDLSHCGGITALKKIAAMAETWYVGVCPHNASSPVHTVATAHVDLNMVNFVMQEIFPLDHEKCPWIKDIVDHPPVPKDGYIQLSNRPGLGIELNEDVIKKHPPKDRPVYSLYSKDSFLLTGVGETHDSSEQF
ncbi:MAG: galactonate dehydratase [Bacillaceae bacterium]|nr:galactonate dehydratase [Bacillaceae bacterium]